MRLYDMNIVYVYSIYEYSSVKYSFEAPTNLHRQNK